ncbi:MAG: sigma-70 family RNA polymerase sigma factor [Clostridia bacterium]|nr:sigma-70 family RNA polymerase sigma factor [Clostridia bacterium]
MTTTETIKQYSKLVHVLALARTNQPSDADDVYQEVFLRYIDKQPKFRDEQHAKAWFIRVTVNITKDMYKSAAHSKRADLDESAAQDEMTDSEFIDQIERKAVFSERIEQLNPRYREVLMLHLTAGTRSRK